MITAAEILDLLQRFDRIAEAVMDDEVNGDVKTDAMLALWRSHAAQREDKKAITADKEDNNGLEKEG